jgi:hypothetical protein
MELRHPVDVTKLDTAHRRALEDVIGAPLQADQRLVICVTEAGAPASSETDSRPVQSLSDWAKVYEGLTDEEIEAIDREIKTRANLTRNVP